ncbi:unnamed protein product [Auanema sp. JU1783]|nr:unnamed protein product [Auanema sp. JU1783]
MTSWSPGSEWWRRWLEDGNSSLYVNRSQDVLCANCISLPDTTACIRSVAVALLAILTAWVAFIRIILLHSNQPSHIRLLLYYLLCVHCIAGSFEWLLGWNTQLALFISYIKAVELVVICYYYLDIASKMMHWSSAAGRRLSFIALFLMFTFFTMFLVMGLLLSIEPWTDCHAPYWIWFSAGEFVIVQLMVGSFLLILKRMSRISASSNIQRGQRNELLNLFWTFETSALADLGYHISLFMLADDNKGCSGVFKHDQVRYTLLKVPYDLFSFLIPIWAILYVFRPGLKRRSDSADLSTEIFNDYPSVVPIANVVVVRNYRRRYRPLTQPTVDDVPVLPGNRSSRNQGGTRLRTSLSSPSIPAARRVSVSRSLVSSPLYSIPEEMYHHYADEEDALVGSYDRCSIAPQIGE